MFPINLNYLPLTIAIAVLTLIGPGTNILARGLSVIAQLIGFRSIKKESYFS